MERDYRQVVSDACFAHATRDGGVALVLYDVTTLYFEAEHADGLFKDRGWSSWRRRQRPVRAEVVTRPSAGVHCGRGSG